MLVLVIALLLFNGRVGYSDWGGGEENLVQNSQFFSGVTGASYGIGRELALQLCEAGVKQL